MTPLPTLLRNIRRRVDRQRWLDDYGNVCELAEWMLENDYLSDAQEVLEFFIHPENWTGAWEKFQESKSCS